MPAHSRRWFAFRLRALFVVVAVLALPLGWVAYQLEWIRQRHRFMAPMQPSPYRGVAILNCQYTPGSRDGARPPWQLALFDEQGITWIRLRSPASIEQLELVRSFFPEANVSDANQP
jgi:hypothetical protein